MRRRVRMLVGLTGLSLVAGCGSAPSSIPTWAPVTSTPSFESNGIEQLPIDQVAAAVTEAMNHAATVHMTGSYQEPAPVDDSGRLVENPSAPARTVTFDVVGTPTRFHALLAIDDLTVELHRDGATVLALGNDRAAAVLGNPELAHGWVSCPVDIEWLQPWLVFTDAPALVAKVLHSQDARPSEESILAVGPVIPGENPVLQLDATSQGKATGTVTVQAQGAPLPVEIYLSDASGNAEVSFTDWGTAITPQMPGVS